MVQPQTVLDPTDPNPGRWANLARFLHQGVGQVEVQNIYPQTAYVRFFLTDESVLCRNDCIKSILMPLSPIYVLPEGTRMFPYFALAENLRGWTKPGVRIRMYWDYRPEVLRADGQGLMATERFWDKADNRPWVWKRVQRDNRRVDNLPQGQPIRVCGYNVYVPASASCE
jgi:hypothetical protein